MIIISIVIPQIICIEIFQYQNGHKPSHKSRPEQMWPRQAAECKDSSPMLVQWLSFASVHLTAVILQCDFLPWCHSPVTKSQRLKKGPYLYYLLYLSCPLSLLIFHNGEGDVFYRTVQ